EAILLSMQVCLRPGDRVVVQTPCYQSLTDVASELGCTVVPWPVRLDGGRATVDWDALPPLLAPPTRLLVTNLPHHPTIPIPPTSTGWLARRGEWDQQAALARERRWRWFVEEMSRGLARADAGELPPAATLVPSAISLWGLSKSLNLPGLRLGWLACRDREFL